MGTEPHRLGSFVLGEWIGEGGASVVHAAIDERTGREVAVKLARPDRDLSAIRRRFEREAAALSVIASDHVVELVSAGTTEDGRPYLVLERLDGRDLQELLDQHGPFKPGEVVRFVRHAARALDLAHGLGIVHRDLKPANLFLHRTPDRRVIAKVLDFGMVVDVGGPTRRSRDAFGGTPMFMAPEQVRGQLLRIGPATDIWAIGMIAVTLLTGERYWGNSGGADVIRAIELSPIEPPSQRWPWLSSAFDAWFVRSTQRVPERRFRSVADQAASLATALRGVSAPSDDTGAVSISSARTPTPSVVRLSGRRSTLIGRELERGAIEQLLAPGVVVTLTGPGGIGKTRLAQAVCDAAGERFVDGAWFVPLAPGTGDEPVVRGIATALGLAPDTTRPTLDHVIASLADRSSLILLDGVERVPECAAALDRLRRACPQVSWLATGRLPLGLDGERCVGVEPLELPRTGVITAGEAETYAAIALFVRNARQAAPTFSLDEETVGDVVAICRAVEGFPLAIELAAARLQTAGLPQIRAELERDPSAAEPSSVRRAVAWSYGLLAPEEQAILRQLALLPDGLTLEQISRELGHLAAEPTMAVLRLAQSHLAAWSSDPPYRLVMLDVVRELCRDRSAAAGEDDALWAVACRHAEEVASVAGDGGGQDAWLGLVDAEHDNLRTVLFRLLEVEPAQAMRLAGRLAWYWYLRGHYGEGAGWLGAAIARSGVDRGPDLTRALHGAGRLALLRCRYDQAEELLERARRLARQGGDARSEATAVQLLGSVARERGRPEAARQLHQRGLELWHALGDDREAGRARNYLVFAAWLGDPAGEPRGEDPAWWRDRAEDELRRLGDAEGIVWALLNRGAIHHHAGDRDRARDALGAAFAEAIATRFHEGIAWSLDLIGRGALARGELLQANAQLAASLRVHRRLGDLWRCASVLEALAAVAIAGGRAARGAAYLGAADAIRQQIAAPVPACERAMVEDTERRGLALIGEAFEAGRERGRRTLLDQVVELAREI